MSAVIYDGTFELAWLRPWQEVRSAGDGACEIIHTETGAVLARIEMGENIPKRLASIGRVNEEG